MPPRREMNGNVVAETPVEGGQEFTAPKTGQKLGGGSKYLLFSPRMFGEDEPILTSIFFRWVVSNMFLFSPLFGEMIQFD